MKHFYRMAEGLDVSGIMAAITSMPELWNYLDVRTSFENSPHREVDDIILRFNDVEEPELHECVNYEPWRMFPEIQGIVFNLMRAVNGTRLGRVMITKLAAGKRIHPHIDAPVDVPTDKEAKAGYYNRYHIVLKSGAGCVFRCGDEKVSMLTGDIWYFDRHTEHEVINNSADDRVHLIVDIRSER